jgi:hypothetical protein
MKRLEPELKQIKKDTHYYSIQLQEGWKPTNPQDSDKSHHTKQAHPTL